ncbi:MAG: tetratricopeptide repeat protein [Pseudomonadota bacterium]
MNNKTSSCELIQWRIWIRMIGVGLALAHFSLCAFPTKVEGALPAIEQITLQSDPPGMRIRLDRVAPFRAVLVEPREVMIAFKGARLSKKVRKEGERGAWIREFTIEHLRGNVVALMVATDQDIREIQTVWDKSVNMLTVKLIPENGDGVSPRKATKEESPLQITPLSKTSPAESKLGMDLLQASANSTGKVAGSEDDLLLIMDGTPCPEQVKFQEGFRQCAKKNWREAFQLLNADLQSGSQHNCREKAYYLRAVAYNKLNQQGDEGLYLEALTYFQDAASFFPDSVYAPYALTSVGKIYKELKNYAEAKGYFKIILEKYADYPGRPEVMFKLGQIYGIEKNMRMSIPIFKDILAKYPESRFATDAKLELGKALYNSNQYSQTLELLNDVLVKEPRKAVENEDMLLVMGNSYYQLGEFQESRDALIRAFNLFPGAETNSITLARIGDILRDTGQPDKANKIYQMVMDRFAGTDGGAISAMRRAALIEDRLEKEKIYRMVLSEYSKHPMASLAIVKLSDLQFKAGEYRNSIETLRPLFNVNPKNLRAEVSYIFQASFMGLLSDLSKADAYLEMVAITHKESQLLRRFEQPEIFRMLGLAHLKGHLYGEATKLFEIADKYFGVDGPPEFYYEYGMALRESGNVEPALKKLQDYIQKAPQGEHVVSANFQIGRILIDQKDANGALGALKKADAFSKVASEKIDILRLTAQAHGLLGDFKTTARLLTEVLTLLTSATEKNTDLLFDVHQQLGETYMKMKSYTEAGNAFEKALRYSGKEEPPSVLVQLGEAYQKSGRSDLALNIYNRVMALEDEFWKNVVRERLQAIRIGEKMKSDRPGQ